MSRPTNTQFALAVHVLTMLAALPRELRNSEEMAGSAGSNPVHIRRVLGRLRAAGLVASRSGRTGDGGCCGRPIRPRSPTSGEP